MSDTDIILKVEGVCKTYLSSQQSKRSVKDLISDPFWKNRDESSHIDALKGVSFELKKGESIGIIGSNGAGKSTLLKILSGITTPSSGKVTINGRVLSVLDIGTGFHPDLTGRENVYLKGQLMGLSKSEIDSKIDGILSFSEIGRFVNEPVKTYSNGMYLRLAFSTLIEFNADIMILDEVMAFGDQEFRDKCRNRFDQIANSSTSVILVSHNLGEISALCDTCIWLDSGGIKMVGSSRSVIDQYTEFSFSSTADKKEKQKSLKAPLGMIEPELVEVSNIRSYPLGNRHGTITAGEPFEIEIEFEKTRTTIETVEVAVYIHHGEGAPLIIDSYGLSPEYEKNTLGKGHYKATYLIEENVLNQGVYTVGIYVCSNQTTVIKRVHNSHLLKIEHPTTGGATVNSFETAILLTRVKCSVEKINNR